VTIARLLTVLLRQGASQDSPWLFAVAGWIAPALLVLGGPVQGGKAQTATVGKNTFTMMTLGKTATEPKADGDTLVLGSQTKFSDGEKITFVK